MQVYDNLYPEIYDFKQLYWSYRNARTGKRYRPEIVRYTQYLEDNLIETQDQLMQLVYKQSPYRERYLYVPKKRLIMALPFKDRVVQWSVYMTLNPILERKYIYDSYACRIGKGAHKSINRLQYWLRKDRSLTYYLTLDMEKYFYRVNHNILLNDVYGKFIADEKLMWLMDQMVRSGDGNLGVTAGSQD